MKATHEYITAIAALTKVIEDKRFHVIEETAYLASIPLVQEINEQARRQIGVDVFSVKNKEEIEKYVEYLNDAVRANIYDAGNQAGIDDEVLLLKSAKEIPTDIFKVYDIKYPHDKIIGDVISAIKLTKPSLNSIIRNADYVQVVSLDFTIYFISARVRIRSKDAVLLFVMQKEPSELSTITVGSIYVFKENTPRISSPVRMFLQAIHKYGVPITMGIKTQKFFYEGFMTSYDHKAITREFTQRSDLRVMVFKGGIQHKYLGVKYEFAYGEEVTRMANDFAKLQFI